MIISKITRTLPHCSASAYFSFNLCSRGKYTKFKGGAILGPTSGHRTLFNYSSDSKLIVLSSSTRNNNRYLQLVDKMRDPTHFAHLKGRLKQIYSENVVGKDYPLLKIKINELLHLTELYSWSQAYHPASEQIPTEVLMHKAEQLIELSLSQKFSHSHETVHDQTSSQFRTLSLSIYFSLTNRISPKISTFYLDSYIHLNRQKNIIQFMRCCQSIAQKHHGDLQKMIVEASRTELEKQVAELVKGRSQHRMDEVEIAIYLNNYRHKQIDNNQLKQIVLKYLAKNTHSHSFLHYENIVYCLYYAIERCGMASQICQWLDSNQAISYLTSLFSHQDKLTCLKVDILLTLRGFVAKNPDHSDLTPTIDSALAQLSTLSFKTWSFKHSIWLALSLTNLNPPDLSLIAKLVQSATRHTLTKQCSLASLMTLLSDLYNQNQLQQLIAIQTSVSSSLASQSDQALLTQSVSGLCSVLHHADRHPALQQLYHGYLLRLLHVSLGHFEWIVLTQLYYFGLRWDATGSATGAESMEYVRRYILNQYSSMGIRRREIPQDSYFYKIHALTTPEQFYRNHLDHH